MQQISYCEIIIRLALYIQLHHDYEHQSVTSQVMDSIHIKQFRLKKNEKAASLIRQCSQPERSAILILGEEL